MLTNKRCIGFIVAVAISICATGCDSGSSKNSGGASMDQMANAVDAQKTAKEQQQQAEASAKSAADNKAAEAAAAPVAQPSAEPKKVGSRPAPEFGGYFGAIAGARRHVMNVVDSIAWIQGVRSFKAEQGRKPKDTAEFMKRVVPTYELQLPRIEDDEEYAYDPNGESDGDFGQLYIVKKGTAASSAPAAK
jgi:hypothetical protein